jgi:hypothetical protein
MDNVQKHNICIKVPPSQILDLINSYAAVTGSTNNNNSKTKDQDQVGIMISDHEKT